MRGLTYSEAAQDDLVATVKEVVMREGEVVAETLLKRLHVRCEDLARFPDMGRRRPELDSFGLPVRTLADQGRLIVYTKRGDMLIVARVLNSEE